MSEGTLVRLSAFTTDPRGGNPAGVWTGDALPDVATMQRTAAEVGFSETVFLAPSNGFERIARYYSPLAEVTFCGHATIAAGAVLGEADGDGTYRLSTLVGEVPVRVETRDGQKVSTLTSVAPEQAAAGDALVDEFLELLGWSHGDLDPAIPPVKAYAGAWHLVLAAAGLERLASLEYDFQATKAAMNRENLTTLQLVHRERPDLFHARNPFPPGGVVEDPATGASAAALGGYLRALSLVPVPSTFVIRQGEAMGRRSRIEVTVPSEGGILVSGTSVRL